MKREDAERIARGIAACPDSNNCPFGWSSCRRAGRCELADEITEALLSAVAAKEAECERLQKAVEAAEEMARIMLKAGRLVGPAEYRHSPRDMRVWKRALYHQGKDLREVIRTALKGDLK